MRKPKFLTPYNFVECEYSDKASHYGNTLTSEVGYISLKDEIEKNKREMLVMNEIRNGEREAFKVSRDIIENNLSSFEDDNFVFSRLTTCKMPDLADVSENFVKGFNSYMSRSFGESFDINNYQDTPKSDVKSEPDAPTE